MARNITPREKDYSQWYLDVIRAGELADYAPVRGCMIIRPNGYALWEKIAGIVDEAIKDTGHENAYFPVLIPSSFLEKEAQHVEGFAPECAVVTHAGGEELEEPLIVRPTSETVIGHMYSKWVQSWRDLPLLYNQWCSVMRWEKRPRLFLRTTEFLWQEGHTAHATKTEAIEETLLMIKIYKELMEENLAMSVITGRKSELERFPGADETYTLEAMMTDKRALQAGTSHFLGQNFAKAFDISFQNEQGERDFVWTTSWAVTTRLIGAIVMIHSDNDGLVLPPRIAPVKAVILPISDDEKALKEDIEPKARELQQELNALLGKRSVKVDTQYHMRPGDRFFYHLQRGIPVRIELGRKEYENKTVRLVRRDTGEKIDVSWENAAKTIESVLESIYENLRDRARDFREKNTHFVSSYEEFKETLEKKGGFITAYFAGTKEQEKTIKSETGATIRCYPDGEDTRGTCFISGKNDAPLTVFAKAY